jgi:hypothetical protein
VYNPVIKKKIIAGLWLVPVMGALLTGYATKTSGTPPLDDQAAAFIFYGRADIREDKAVLINENINLNPSYPNYDAFWHEYYPYEAELKKVNNERLQLIRDYQFNLDKMNDQTADSLAGGALVIHKKELELPEKYYQKIKEATSPLIAARFLQVEYQVGLLRDAEIASQIPLPPEKK